MPTYVVYHRAVVEAESPDEAKNIVVFGRQWPQEEKWTVTELPTNTPLNQQ